MTANYSAVLTRCMILSSLGLASSLLGILPPLVPFLLGLAPLLWYHLGYLRKFAGEGISQPAVDSVYYYGFLVTIGALGVTALELSLKGVDGDLSKVAFQFGLGLLATGYAVWARIQLTASSKLLDEANLEEAMHRYVSRSRELVSTVELATNSFQNFANEVIAKTDQFATRVEEQTKVAVDTAAQDLRGAVSSMAEESKLALSDLRGIINDTTFGAERDALKASVTSMVETVTKLSQALTNLKVTSSASAETVGTFAHRLEDVTTHASGAASKLEALGQDKGALDKFRDALATSEQRIGVLGLSADVAAASTTGFSDKISSSYKQLDELGEAAKRGGASLHRLTEKGEPLTEFNRQVQAAMAVWAEAAKSSSTASQTFEEVNAKLQALRETLDNLNAALIDSTGGLKDSMISTADALDTHLQTAIRRSADLSDAVERLGPVATLQAEGGGNGVT